jgi:hypothetical protein
MVVHGNVNVVEADAPALHAFAAAMGAPACAFRDFAEFLDVNMQQFPGGVAFVDLLTAATGKSTAQIAEMAAKGKLGKLELDQLMTALESGKGLEKFNGLMEKQAQSLTGL